LSAQPIIFLLAAVANVDAIRFAVFRGFLDPVDKSFAVGVSAGYGPIFHAFPPAQSKSGSGASMGQGIAPVIDLPVQQVAAA